MTAEHNDIEIPPENWSELLSDELRAHFERVGEELVTADVSNHRYSTANKHFAAVHWLGLKRAEREKREALTLKLVIVAVVVSAVTLVATVAALF